jgi:hypothetical protein
MKKLLKNKIIAGFLIAVLGFSSLWVNQAQAVSYPVPHILTTAGVTMANGNFLPLAQTMSDSATSTEAHVQTYMTEAGTWSGLSVYLRTANASGDTTFTVRKNGVDTSLAVTVPQSATGLYQDLSDTVSVSVADLMSIGVTTTAGSSANVPSITALFSSDSGDSVQYNMAFDAGSYSSGTSPRYFRIAGHLQGAPTVEASNQGLIQHDATITSIGAYVSANARTTATTFVNRINGADGTNTFSVASTSTGLFIDTAHSDALTAGDLINARYHWASGANAIVVRNFQYTIVSDNPREITFMGGSTLSKNSSTGTAWNFLAGAYLNSGVGEAVGRSYPITPGVMSGMAHYSSANTATQDLTFQSRKNGANATEVVVVTAGVTGWFQDVTNSDTFDSDDFTTLNGSRSVAGTGSTSVQNQSVLYTMDLIADGFIPQVDIF